MPHTERTVHATHTKLKSTNHTWDPTGNAYDPTGTGMLTIEFDCRSAHSIQRGPVGATRDLPVAVLSPVHTEGESSGLEFL